MTIWIMVGLVYLSGAFLAYGLTKGTVLKCSPTVGWDVYDSYLCVLFGLLSWLDVWAVVFVVMISGDKIGFALRVPKAMKRGG